MECSLCVLQWNARSLQANAAELRNYVVSAAVKPHVICIQETWLQPLHNYSLAGYNCERRDRAGNQRGGGVLTLIIGSLSYSVLDAVQGIEEISVKITSQRGSIIISNIYNPPNLQLNIDIYNLIFACSNCLIVGDFNSFSTLWGSSRTDNNGSTLETLVDQHDLVVLNTGEGTHIKRDGDLSHLDLSIVSKRFATRAAWSVLQDPLGSDHLPVVTTLDARPTLEETSRTRWAISRANWTLFSEECRAIPTEPQEGISTLEAYDSFSGAILGAANIAIPKRKSKATLRPVPFWNEACSDAIRARNAARNRANKTKLLDDCITYRKLKAKAQYTLRSARRTCWEDFCTTLTSTTKLGAVWRMAKKMTGTSTNPSMPNLVKDGRTYESNAEKADLLAKTYAAVSSDANYTPAFAEHRQAMEEQWSAEETVEDTPSNPLNEPFSQQELRVSIERGKNNTSAGPDSITYEMVKHLPDTANNHLLALFNRIWSEGALIPAWKESLVIPLPKVEADKSKPESYRPIALTSVMCKLFERLIVNRLEWFLEGSSSINPLQSGFRKQRCTIDHVVRLQDDIHKSLHNKENTLAVFLDFSKAFDMVWSEGLLNKLSLHGVNGRMLRWISDFLTGRSIRVAVGGIISNCFEMQNGTPQGSILSPILFNIMINDLPTPVDLMTRSSIFADDSAAWRSGRNVSFLNRKLQKQLDAVADWSDRWGFKLSETKTIAVLFGSHHKLSDVNLTIKGVPVPVQTEAKFLGVTFDHRLSWKPHIDNLVTRCKRVTNLMKSLTGSHWGASKTGLLSVYRSLTRSKLDYGCQAYYAASASQLTRLDRIQSQCL